MGFWVFMLFCCLLLPATLLGCGTLLSRGLPFDSAMGFKTPMSTKNEQTWAFANFHCGRLLKKCGWVSLPVTVLVFLVLLFFVRDKDIVGTIGGVLCIVTGGPLLAVIPITERALHKNFHKDGTPRLPEE